MIGGLGLLDADDDDVVDDAARGQVLVCGIFRGCVTRAGPLAFVGALMPDPPLAFEMAPGLQSCSQSE